MAIGVKKITDYRKIGTTLYEVHPKTEAGQVTYNGSNVASVLDEINTGLDDAIVSITADATTALKANYETSDGTTGSFTLKHPAYTARTGKPTGNQTPTFGGTFTISQITSDATGHVTNATDRTVTIPALPDATDTTKGVVLLSDATNGTATAASGVTAATPKAVADALTAAKSYADGLVTSAMHFKGTIGTDGTPGTLPTSGNKVGDTYRVVSAGTYAGQVCEVGDLIVCVTGGAGTWTVVQNNVDVFGAASASAAGSIGLVPAPAKGDQGKVLSGAATWVDMPQAGTATPKAAGTAAVGTSIKYAREDHVHPAQTSVSGNAGTATKFASAQSVALTGDVTGSASSQAGWSVATALSETGVTAGNYGPDANASPAHGATFSVPYITVDAKGRITAASTKTITLPADSNTHYESKTIIGTSATATANAATANTTTFLNHIENGAVKSSHQITGSGTVTVAADANGRLTITGAAGSDTKVTQTVTTTAGEYPLLAKNTTAVATVTDTARFVSGVTVNPSTGKITAKEFNAFIMSSTAPTDSTDISGLAANGIYTHYYD